MQPRRESIKFALWQGSNRSVITTTRSVWLPVIILQLLDIGATAFVLYVIEVGKVGEAQEIINRSLEDYKCHFDGLDEILRPV